MEADIQQDQSIRNRYGSAPYMNAKEKQISFYNRYFVFKKISSVDVEDVYKSVTGIHVFEDKMNRRDTKSAQMTALKFAEAMGESASSSSIKYRPSAAARLQELAGQDLPEASNTVVSQLFESVAPASLSSKKKSVKGANLFSLGEAASSSPLVVKKSAVLQPVKSKVPVAEFETSSPSFPSLSQSILGKSKLGTKASVSKLGKLKSPDIFAGLSFPEEKEPSVVLKGRSKPKTPSESGVKSKKGDDGK